MKEGETMDFSERLKHYREKAGFKTGKEFAKALNISYPSYMAYENKGREPKYSVLMEIAEKLGISIDELLGYKPSEEKKYIRFLQDLGFSIQTTPTQIIIEWPQLKLSKWKIEKKDFLSIMNELQNSIKYKYRMGDLYAQAFDELLTHNSFLFLKQFLEDAPILDELLNGNISNDRKKKYIDDTIKRIDYFNTNITSDYLKSLKEKYMKLQEDLKNESSKNNL